MNDLKGKRILIFQQRGWGITIGHPLAKSLHHLGYSLAALTIKHETHQYVVSQKEVPYELIVSGDTVKEDPAGFLGESDITLTQICEDLGVESVWPLAQSLRNHVKCYSDKYYYGFKQNRSDEDIILYVKAIYKNVQNIFEEFKPDIIIAPNFVALQHIIFSLYAKKRNVEMIGLSDSKVENIIYFPRGYKEERGSFNDRFKKLEDGEKSKSFEKAIRHIESSRKSLVLPKGSTPHGNKTSLKEMILTEIRPFYISLKYMLKSLFKKRSSTGVTLDNLSPKYILRDHYVRKKYIHGANNFPYCDFKNIGKNIYFPLQFQPEETIDVQSARFNNQIETARQVAMSLPGDYTLVVKDHPAMLGYRPLSYLEKVSRTPNIKLIDYRISTEKILKNTSLVVSINGGTILMEAALLKVPAIQLGHLGKTRLLPNVFYHPDFLTISSKIEEILAMLFDTDDYEKSLINYVTAMYDVGIDIDYCGIWEGRTTEGLGRLIDKFVHEISTALNSKGVV